MSTARGVAKNTTILFLGRVLSTGLGVVYVTVLARYIQAEGMGKIGTATSLVSMLHLLISFGLSEVIVRDIASHRARAGAYLPNILVLRVLLSTVFALVVVGITAMAHYPSDTIVIIYIYAVAYAIDDLTDVAFSMFNAFEKMEYPAGIQTLRDLVNISLSLAAVRLHASLVTIVLVSALANVFKLVVSLAVLRLGFVQWKPKIDVRLCRRLLVAALPFAALGILQVANQQIDTVLLSVQRPAQDVGWFSAAGTLINYLLLFPTVFLQAIFPVFSRFRTHSREALQQAYRSSFKFLVVFGFALCAGTIATAEHVIAIVYGPGFENAAVALQILAASLAWMFGFANGALLNATGGQTLLAAVTGAGVVLNVIAALVLIPQWSFVGASVASIVPGVIFAVPLTLTCHRRLGMRPPYASILKTLFCSLCMGAAVAVCLRASMNLFVTVFGIAPLVYGVSLLLLRVIGHEDIALVAQLLRRRD